VAGADDQDRLARHDRVERGPRPGVAYEPRVARLGDGAQERRDHGQLVARREHDRIGVQGLAILERDPHR
jgi:hypothetical protein